MRIIVAQMELSHLLAERQHKDAEKLFESSRRVEVMTMVVMALTVVISFFASITYFAQVPGVGLTYAPLPSFVLVMVVFLMLRGELGRRGLSKRPEGG